MVAAAACSARPGSWMRAACAFAASSGVDMRRRRETASGAEAAGARRARLRDGNGGFVLPVTPWLLPPPSSSLSSASRVAGTRVECQRCRRRRPRSRRGRAGVAALDVSCTALSVVVPAHNRLPSLRYCLAALEDQCEVAGAAADYEVIVVDDGSSDGTAEWVRAQRMPHVRLLALGENTGAANARNRGAVAAQGDVLAFVDSDVVVSRRFVRTHIDAHERDSAAAAAAAALIAVGPVIHTHDLGRAREARFNPLFDASRAYFCTSNASVTRRYFLRHGMFDLDFTHYGWEDLEAGERMRRHGGARHVRLRQGAVGFHYKPPFTLDQMGGMVQRERERGQMGVVFLRKAPTLSVRMMVQLTPVHRALWSALTLFGLVNERSVRPVLAALVRLRRNDAALFLFTIVLNKITCDAVHQAAATAAAAHRARQVP